MNYVEIFKDSAAIFWKNKSLWLFGLILAVVGQGEYGFSVNYQQQTSFSVSDDSPPDIPNPFDIPLIRSIWENPIPYLVGFVLFIFIWWLISTVVGWLAQGALIGMVDEIDHNGSTSIATGWRVGKERLGPLFKIAILFALPQIILVLPVLAGGIWFFFQMFDIFGPVLIGGDVPPSGQIEEKFLSILPFFLGGLACFIPLVCFGNILGWALRLLNKMVARSCVLENLDVVESVKRGWEIVWQNIGYTLLNWFILAIIRGVFAFAAAIPALLLLILTGQAFFNSEWSMLAIVSGLLLLIYMLVVALGLGGILNSFNSTLWTKLYKTFVAKERPAAAITAPS